MGKGRFDLDALVERLLEEAPLCREASTSQSTPPDADGNAVQDGNADGARPGASPAMSPAASPGSSPAMPYRGLPQVAVSPEMRDAAQKAAAVGDPRIASGVHKHPLAAARAALGLSGPQYLKQINRIYQRLGFGAMACRPEKVSRWEAGVWCPERPAQVAMATLHNIPYELLDEFPWPQWLLYAFPDDGSVLSTPWTPGGTVAAMASCVRGGAVDRRGFLIATGTTLGTIATEWSDALGGMLEGSATGRRLTLDTVVWLEQRLDALRRLEDGMGGSELCRVACTEFELVNHLADGASYDEATGRRLFSAVAEAGRIAGWIHYDHGLHATAQKYFITALRASATAGDAQVGASILSCMANQTYNIGNPQDAINLLETAQTQAQTRATPRVQAMLHLRTARAYSKTPYGRYACARELEKARAALAQGPHDDDPPWAYWVSAGELEMMAGISALDLGDPRRALGFFEAARSAEIPVNAIAKDNAICLARTAEAHLALGEIDEACGIARQAFLQGKDVNSGRQSGVVADFRKRLQADHRGSKAAKEFLDLTAV